MSRGIQNGKSRWGPVWATVPLRSLGFHSQTTSAAVSLNAFLFGPWGPNSKQTELPPFAGGSPVGGGGM